MGWHKDSDPNDGDNDHPIVSISLGQFVLFREVTLTEKFREYK